MAIDGDKIIHAVMEGSRIRDAKGIIPLFGVYLSIFFTEYYNRLSFEFEGKMGDRGDSAADLLVHAAQECGYATFHGIRTSWEWEQLVSPMVEHREDQLIGFTAVALAFGWGDMTVTRLLPEEELVIRVTDSYEASGYLETRGRASSGKCYMLRGVTAAFMDLLYGEPYPDGLADFTAKETLCRAKGDARCEFVAKRTPR